MNNDTYFLFTITAIMIFFTLITISIIVFIVKSRKIVFEKELKNKNLEIEFQREILEETILTREEERKRIAQDLHDDIGSKLSTISLNLFLLNSKKTKEDAKESIIANTIDINNKAIETARKIAYDLYPAVLENFGLKAALEELFLDYNNTNAVKIDFKSNLRFVSTISDHQLQIFRIIQELINNSIKHGKATQIDVSFSSQAGVNKCEYRDNGVGFDSLTLNKIKGLGSINIDSRIKNIKGTSTLFSRPNEGFKFDFTFR